MKKNTDVTYEHIDRPIIGIINNIGAFPLFESALRNRLSVVKLVGLAKKRSGLVDFGGDDYIEPLEVLIGSLLTEANLNALGLVCIHEHLTGALVRRLQLVDALKKNPAIENGEVVAPISIIGLPRTGTTILHELLSSNSAFRHLSTWEADSLFPHPEERTYKTDPRIQSSNKTYEFLRYICQGIDAIHEMGAELPQECILLQELSIRSRSFLSYHVPSYMRWLESCDMTPSYQWHKKALQYLQYKFKRDRWVLKNPHQFWSMDKFLDVYPDAVLVQTHRNVNDVLPSITSLCAKLQGCYTKKLDPFVVGEEMLTSLSCGINTLMQYRHNNKWANNHFIDVMYQDIVDHPVETAEIIMRRAGVPVSGSAMGEISSCINSRPQHRNGRHVYKKEWFGFGGDEINSAFGDYHARYGL